MFRIGELADGEYFSERDIPRDEAGHGHVLLSCKRSHAKGDRYFMFVEGRWMALGVVPEVMIHGDMLNVHLRPL